MPSLMLDEAAKKACARRGWTITNLELQKLLYLAQLMYKRRYPNGKLVDTDFQAWDLGPVAPSLYHKAKVFGSEPVKNIFHSVENVDKELDVYLYDTCDKLKGKSAAYLVQMTHRTGGAWARYYRPDVSGVYIPDEAIREEAETFNTP